MTLRALDYLPAAGVSFADYARAVIAADQASHPDPEDDEERRWLKAEFLARGIACDEHALDVTAPDVDFGTIDLNALLANDTAARSFVEQYRTLLRIPADSPFTVGPRLKVAKKNYHRTGEVTATECLVKAWWPDPASPDAQIGTTLAIDWATRRPRVLLTTDRSDRPQEAALRPYISAHLAGRKPKIR